ncbi:DUF3558 domain-containing protein [Rhodococcus hoagii]|uniref:DUF3558 domain-containing protein n=1 Tax=Rhodococcus hoagii TaxID=43767 RepID=UPI000A1012AA|nr:DUF3558 domain-containing protein [Prescottella equi]MBM4597441.1 DUF3558 domain-containing protein [Prescottella equi]MBM4599819.1 DUF3558 domain-containing protein [Prescottella equi]
MRVTAVIGLIGAGLLLAGCGPGTVSGEADAEGTAAGEPVFSPCDDIPDDAVRSLGMDPATESRDIFGVEQPGWKICEWHGSGPYLTVFSTTYTLDDVRANDSYTQFSDVQVGGRVGLTYRKASENDGRTCEVALPSGQGAVLLSVAYLGVDAVTEDPCSVVERAARKFVEVIPD